MSWVFLALVFMIVSLLVWFLRQIMDSVSKNRYYPPSDALIDQVLPEEVFEHVISFSDPLTLLRCQSVSKYWHYNASKSHIKSEVLQNAINEVQNLPDIKTSILSYPNTWMKYSENYRIEQRLADFALAKKRDHYLLEIDDQTSLLNLRQANFVHKCVVKIRGKVLIYPTFQLPALGKVQFNKGSNLFASVVVNKKPDYYNQELYEVLAPLEECLKPEINPELMMCRAINPAKRFGFIVLDNSFLRVMLSLFVPLIVHDVLYSESFMNILKQWFGTAAYLFLITWFGAAHMLSVHVSHLNSGFFKKMIVATIITTLIAFVTFYPLSAEHFGFVFCFLVMFIYGVLVVEHVCGGLHHASLRIKDRNSLMLLITILVLVIFMNDWRLVYQSILDRVLFHRLLKNTVHYVIFVVYCIWSNSLLTVMKASPGEKWQVFGRFLFSWDRRSTTIILSFYGCVVLAALYAPYWKERKMNWAEIN